MSIDRDSTETSTKKLFRAWLKNVKVGKFQKIHKFKTKAIF